ncbi:hypothetical protein [Paenibacillus sp. Root444D2]|uniref:hypothetical protein n=1 Tax=Paenibacillus sp. Root444D2 TaxID=1736538 RepID=UPI00070F4D71|nr:hypothetical protein [Paenibacillus sp. Root444D2]KQX69212.1 hypothetical protein ASD40_01560 [Paenibacillus sp. Root444D2]
MADYPDNTPIKDRVLHKESVLRLLNDIEYFELTVYKFTVEESNQYTEFDSNNGSHNYYLIRSNGKLVMSRTLVDLSLFDTGEDDYGLDWNTSHYNKALFDLGIKVYHKNGTNKRAYKKAIDSGLLEYRADV